MANRSIYRTSDNSLRCDRQRAKKRKRKTNETLGCGDETRNDGSLDPYCAIGFVNESCFALQRAFF